MKNNHIEEYIEYYCKLSVAPEYALFIKGPWGCGKTHLVSRCIDRLEGENNSLKFLRVSLYGVGCIEDIEDKFFQILNPVLSSKPMVLAGRFAKGVLKGALKIDLDDDGKTDATITPTIPEIKVSDYLTDTNDCIFVFDDLERCSLDLKSILGYINYFVEKNGYKAIIIADEEKLISKCKCDDGVDFSLVKEKLIGKDLEVEADIESVISQFIDSVIVDKSLKEVLLKSSDDIIVRFYESGYGNLRSLRKTFLELERFWDLLDEDVKESHDLLYHVFDLFIVLSMEVYSGTISPKEIKNLIGSATVSRQLDKNNGGEKFSKFNKVDAKYNLDFYETILDVLEWVCIFDGRHIDAETLNKSLKRSRYFLDEKTPAWVKLWHLYQLDDDEFEELLTIAKQEFYNNEYLDVGVIKHVIGIFLNLSRVGLIKKSVDQVVSECTHYIDRVFSCGEVEITDDSLKEINGYGGCYGLGYTDNDSEEFKKLSVYLNGKILSAQKELLSKKTNVVVDTIKHSVGNLHSMLCGATQGEISFYDKPVLQFISVDEFVELVLEISNESKRTVFEAISSRYKHQIINTPLLEELTWLESVSYKIYEILDGMKEIKPSSITLKYCKSKLDIAINDLSEKKSADS